jgi:hypothetical protein
MSTTPIEGHAKQVAAGESSVTEETAALNFPPARATGPTHELAYMVGPSAWSVSPVDQESDAAKVPEAPQGIPAWGDESSKSYIIPAVDIVGFQLALNLFNRNFDSEADIYKTDGSSIQHNLQSGWVIDKDPFATNQFLHPYQGSIYHGFARSAGLNYWEALGYDFVGSAIWEVAGETGAPSMNDQITTSFGGSFLGEALYRMSNFLLEPSGGRPGFFRGLGAAVTSPSASFNRLAFGDRFDGVFPSHDPATYSRIGIGVRRNDKLDNVGPDDNSQSDELVGDVVMDYGLPGKPNYEYTRPFDYFHFEATVASSQQTLPEDVQVRGLLVGSKYELGHDYRGVWGLYGAYDYISPEVFSVSSTSINLGTTGQWWLSKSVALQGTGLAGLGWTAAGTVGDASTGNDYHYGASPQVLGALRVIFGSVAVLDMTGRAYYLGSLQSGGNEDSETILRGKIALTARVYGHHALGLQYVASSRDARYTAGNDTYQSIGAVSIFYTYIGDTDFGAVEWR